MILTSTGQKGGGGKSTLLIAIGAELAARGEGVLLIDADPQGTTATWADVGDVTPGVTIPDMAAPLNGKPVHVRVTEALAEGTHDHILIDVPGRLGDAQRQALLVADVALLPVAPSAADGWAVEESTEMIETARGKRAKSMAPLKVGIVITKFRSAYDDEKALRTRLKTEGATVLKSTVGYRQALIDMLAAGQGVTTYARRSEAAKEIRRLTDEVLRFAGERGRA
jgi:chromosome partitioning protein